MQTISFFVLDLMLSLGGRKRQLKRGVRMRTPLFLLLLLTAEVIQLAQ